MGGRTTLGVDETRGRGSEPAEIARVRCPCSFAPYAGVLRLVEILELAAGRTRDWEYACDCGRRKGRGTGVRVAVDDDVMPDEDGKGRELRDDLRTFCCDREDGGESSLFTGVAGIGILAHDEDEGTSDSSRSLMYSSGALELAFMSRLEDDTERKDDTEVRDWIPNADADDADETLLLVLVRRSVNAIECFCHEVGGRAGRNLLPCGVLVDVRSSE